MEKSKQDVLTRAYAMLSSLRKNIAQLSGVEEKYVNEFHIVLDKLEKIDISVSEFRIPDSMVKPKVTMSHITRGGAEHIYSDEKYVDKALILVKLDAILGYFEIITAEKPRKIGYHTPDNQ